MVFGVTPETVARLTSYDGKSRLFENGAITSHHPQELMDLAQKLGHALLFVERYPSLTDGVAVTNVFCEIDADKRFGHYLKAYTGMLCGFKNGRAHMCAWNRTSVYDPHGEITTIIDERYLWTIFLAVV